MPSVILLGASGFVGYHLLDLLARKQPSLHLLFLLSMLKSQKGTPDGIDLISRTAEYADIIFDVYSVEGRSVVTAVRWTRDSSGSYRHVERGRLLTVLYSCLNRTVAGNVRARSDPRRESERRHQRSLQFLVHLAAWVSRLTTTRNLRDFSTTDDIAEGDQYHYKRCKYVVVELAKAEDAQSLTLQIMYAKSLFKEPGSRPFPPAITEPLGECECQVRCPLRR